jgi:hypothetical protein
MELDKEARIAKALWFVENHCNTCGRRLPREHRYAIKYNEHNKPYQVKVCGLRDCKHQFEEEASDQ